jgi:hypothetical protein
VLNAAVREARGLPTAIVEIVRPTH